VDIAKSSTTAGTAYATMPLQAGGPAPTLIVLAMAGESTLKTEPYCIVGTVLHGQGWNVVSLDLPCHGPDQREDEPEGLSGWAARTANGEDIVAYLRQRVNDVLGHLIATKVADPAYIAAAGTSRGGFMAFQSAAGNPIIRAVAGFAPVTDLIALSEFAGQEQNPLIRRLALVNEADALSDRAAWVMIGNADDRVGTDNAISFSQALIAAGRARSIQPNVTLHVMPEPGHSSVPEWFQYAAVWLRQELQDFSKKGDSPE
jgi:dienelactone hydrolase